MKPFGIAVTSLLFLLLGSTAIAFSQEAHEEEAKPAAHQEEARPAEHPETAAPPPRQEAPRPEAHPQPAHPEQPAAKPVPPAQQAHPVTRQDEMKPVPHSQEARPPESHPEPQTRPAQQPEARPVPQPSRQAETPHPEPGHGRQPTPEERRTAQAAWQSHRAQNWASEHRTWQQRGGYRGYRIPEARYSAYFGPAHVFPIYSVPVTVVSGYPRFQYQGFWFTVVDPWPASWGDDWYYNDNVYIVYTDGGYYLVNPSYPGVQLAVNVAM